MDSFEFEEHLCFYNNLLGVSNNPNVHPETRDHAIKEAQWSHALAVFDPLRDCIFQAMKLANVLKNETARYYSGYGLGRRFSMLFDAYRSITFTGHPERKEPLSSKETSRLRADINTFYINIRGSLDNLAWIYAYEKGGLPENFKPANIGFFNKHFRKLPCCLEIEAELETFIEWHRELAEIRDPVAHRIPLYIVPAAQTREEYARSQEMQSEHLRLTAALKFEEARELMVCIDSIGKFSPYFLHDPRLSPIPIYPTVPSDAAKVIELTRVIEKVLVS